MIDRSAARENVELDSTTQGGAERRATLHDDYGRHEEAADGAVGGAVVGGVVGAVVAGPIGAAVGILVGAAAGEVAGAADQRRNGRDAPAAEGDEDPQVAISTRA